MSYEASAWAWTQKGLKPAVKMVLLALANCHNPHHGCFPSQAKLAVDTEMNERSVRTHLGELEERGLIRRVEVPRDGGRFPVTRYILGFEDSPGRQRKDRPAENSSAGKKASPPAENSCAHQRKTFPPNTVRGNLNRNSKSREARDVLCEVASPEVVDDFIAHRRAKRAKLTERAAELIAARLKPLGVGMADAALLRSIEHGWTGVFPEAAGPSNDERARLQALGDKVLAEMQAEAAAQGRTLQ